MMAEDNDVGDDVCDNVGDGVGDEVGHEVGDNDDGVINTDDGRFNSGQQWGRCYDIRST